MSRRQALTCPLVIKAWDEGLAGMADKIFVSKNARRNPETSLITPTTHVQNDPVVLREMMNDGALFGGDVIAEPVSAASRMEKLLFSTILQGVWTTGIAFSYPVVVLPDGIPQDGTGCEGYKPTDVKITGSNNGNGKLTEDSDEQAWLDAFVCDEELGAAYCERLQIRSKVKSANYNARAHGCKI